MKINNRNFGGILDLNAICLVYLKKANKKNLYIKLRRYRWE